MAANVEQVKEKVGATSGLAMVATRSIDAPAPLAHVQFRRVTVVCAGLLFFQLLLYQGAFSIRPSADDYILAQQIRLGEVTGPAIFFTSSPLTDYRPLQSLAYWMVGRWNAENPFPLIHALNFAAFGCYLAVFAIWISRCRLSALGAVSGIGMLLLHPVLAGPLADLDGFSRFVVSGWVWLGAYSAFTYADRLVWAVPLTAFCLAMGLGFMEYAVALVPLAALAVWFGRQTARIQGATIVVAVLLVIVVFYLVIRSSIVGPATGRLSLNPLTWATNLTLLGVAVTFMGDTVSVYLERTAGALTAAVLSIAAVVLMLTVGAWLWRRQDSIDSDRQKPSRQDLFGFLILGSIASFTPMVFMEHVSEIYTTAIVFPFALLAGVAIDGWASARRIWLYSCVALLSLHLVWGSVSINSKVARIRATGERAEAQMQDLLRWIPVDRRDVRVGLVFLEPELPARRTYSVFVAGDDHLIQPGVSARAAIEWFRPGANIDLVHLVLRDRSQLDLNGLDAALYWNPRTRKFEPIKV